MVGGYHYQSDIDCDIHIVNLIWSSNVKTNNNQFAGMRANPINLDGATHYRKSGTCQIGRVMTHSGLQFLEKFQCVLEGSKIRNDGSEYVETKFIQPRDYKRASPSTLSGFNTTYTM